MDLIYCIFEWNNFYIFIYVKLLIVFSKVFNLVEVIKMLKNI